MMDHPIALSSPSKLERFGVCYHGLFLAPLNQYGWYKFSDIEIITRSGRRIKPIEPKLKDGSELREYYPVKLSRPVLYMHPMAASSVEEDTGIDFSGYCITYHVNYSNEMPTYLSRVPARYAYTPDSEGQGVVFRNEDTYISPIRIGKPINPGGYVSLPTLAWFAKVLSVTPDGRTRVKGSFPDLADIFNVRHWSSVSGQAYGPEPFIESYSLSGELGSIIATPVAVAQPEYSYDTDSKTNVGERVTRVSVLVPGVGVCTDPSIWTAEAEITRKPMPESPDYSRFYEKMISDIDACADALSPTFLSCSVEIERVVSNSDYADGEGSISWGEQCGLRDNDRLCIGTSGVVNTSKTSTLLESESISLTGWGGSSSGSAEYRSSLESVFNSRSVDGIEVSRTETNNFESSIIVIFDGQTMMSKQNWPPVEAGQSLRYALPRAIQGAETDVRLIFPHCDNEKGLIDAGVNYARSAFYKMPLSADGVHALACLVTEGTVAFSSGVGYFLDPATIKHRLVIGRIFGFGISVPGREITEAEMNSQLFIAYDPLEKKFSDIYTHPVFFQ